MSLAGRLLLELERDIDSLTLVPGSGGVFDVTVDGDLVYSKQKTGRFPEPGEVESRLSS